MKQIQCLQVDNTFAAPSFQTDFNAKLSNPQPTLFFHTFKFFFRIFTFHLIIFSFFSDNFCIFANWLFINLFSILIFNSVSLIHCNQLFVIYVTPRWGTYSFVSIFSDTWFDETTCHSSANENDSHAGSHSTIRPPRTRIGRQSWGYVKCPTTPGNARNCDWLQTLPSSTS
jgi:hypothetical protein